MPTLQKNHRFTHKITQNYELQTKNSKLFPFPQQGCPAEGEQKKRGRFGNYYYVVYTMASISNVGPKGYRLQANLQKYIHTNSTEKNRVMILDRQMVILYNAYLGIIG